MTTRASTGPARATEAPERARRGRAQEPRTRLRVSVVAAALVALGLVVLGSVYAATRPPEWTAETHLLVGPGNAADQDNLSAYYETLSRGQVTATAAAIVDQEQFLQGARTSLGLQDAGSSTARVTVVPGTSLVSVTVTAPSARTAESLADAVARRSTPVVNRLLTPYGVEPLESARGSATTSGLSTGQLTALVAIVALVAGFGTQQVVLHWFTGPRPRSGTSAP